MNAKKKQSVLLGMSGGVDSSVAAALLVEQGYDVTGCHLCIWIDEEPKRQKHPETDAKAVADALGIPFITVDLREDFKKEVVDPFTKAFTKGKTPNPCILCNKTVKFAALIHKADELGFDYVATGHYAKIERVDGTYVLSANSDPIKDQSYFLYRLTQKDLARILFPLGGMEKGQVRKEAEKRDLITKYKKESQGICFIADKDHEAFLRNRIEFTPGSIIDEEGNILGQHEGLPFYTLGQRAPIGGPDGPWFVTKLDRKNNRLIVTNNPFDPDLFARKIKIEHTNWTIGTAPDPSDSLSVKVRHGHTPVPCTVKITNKQTAEIHLQAPIRAVMPGQSAVLYDNNIVIGGGVIKSTTPATSDSMKKITQPVNDIE